MLFATHLTGKKLCVIQFKFIQKTSASHLVGHFSTIAALSFFLTTTLVMFVMAMRKTPLTKQEGENFEDININLVFSSVLMY